MASWLHTSWAPADTTLHGAQIISFGSALLLLTRPKRFLTDLIVTSVVEPMTALVITSMALFVAEGSSSINLATSSFPFRMSANIAIVITVFEKVVILGCPLGTGLV